MDIEQAYTGWIVATVPLVMPKDEIADVEIKAFKGDDEELDGSYIVRITKKSPTVEIVAANETQAKELYRFFNRSKKVVNLFDCHKNM